MNKRLFHRPARHDDNPEYKALLEEHPIHSQLREHLEAMWSQFRHLASDHCQSEFPRQTHRRFWEMYLCAALLDSGLCLEELPDDSPDARIRLPSGKSVWLEAIAADAGEIDNPNSVPPLSELPPGVVKVIALPEEQILLRITSAIASKIKQRAKRIQRNIVTNEDPYIIAVNAGNVPYAMASREPPIVLRAIFPIGHQYFTLNRFSHDITDSGWTFRSGIIKKPKIIASPALPTSACSGASRAPIPGQAEQGFRSKVSSCSGDAEQAFRACRAPIPVKPSRHSGEAEHPR
ncbi:hypothetical protein EJ065_3885 [Corallococcus coralloides]|uniref:Uncharacterized protein n=1 Tax=Corallococcus coralloides TaxID=184914 RepID=A0A410RU75_CORCK|nr:hypothetical protein [Corallococcus coralloides]QAT85445.1 hypothetical protein EJ065_3885 [Corallococcus coralloides]